MQFVGPSSQDLLIKWSISFIRRSANEDAQDLFILRSASEDVQDPLVKGVNPVHAKIFKWGHTISACKRGQSRSWENDIPFSFTAKLIFYHPKGLLFVIIINFLYLKYWWDDNGCFNYTLILVIVVAKLTRTSIKHCYFLASASKFLLLGDKSVKREW